MLDFPYFRTRWRHGSWLSAVWALTFGLCWLPQWAHTEGVEAAIPMRNLVVEWRMAGQDEARGGGTGIRQGRVIIDSRRGTSVQGDVRAGTWQTESETRSSQQVQVLNGGRARLLIGRSQPYTTWQWAYAANLRPGSDAQRGAVQAWGQTVWLDLGQGLSVRPRWPGGQAPVTVELEARTSGASPYEPDGQVRYSEVVSTLAVPLGEWVTVARSGRQAQKTRSGTLSTDSIDGNVSEQLDIRITAP